MVQRNISEAKAQLSKLVAMVEDGSEVLLTRAGKPVARLIPYAQAGRSRKPGALKGKIKIAKDFEFSSAELAELFDIPVS